MSAFRKQVEQLPTLGMPPATITLDPSAFAATWESRPATAVTFGLRVPSEMDVQQARAEATRIATELQDDTIGREEAFEDALLAQLVSFALCNPEDVTEPHPLLELPQDEVPLALTSATIRFVYDAVDKLQVETGPLYPEADDAEIGLLAARLSQPDALDDLPRSAELRVRRFLRMVLDDLKARDDATIEH